MSPPLVSAKRDLAACDQCGKRRVGRALRGDAGLSCLANVCRVGPPHPKRELHKLHKFPGVAPQPMAVARACWADGRPARRPRGVQGARHPPERAAASPPGARTARRPPQAASCARARAVGIFYRGDKKLPSAEGQNNGLRGVPVIVGSRHGPCSGPGLARHAPRARTRRAWGSGCRVRGPRRIVRSMQGCRDRSHES